MCFVPDNLILFVVVQNQFKLTISKLLNFPKGTAIKLSYTFFTVICCKIFELL